MSVTFAARIGDDQFRTAIHLRTGELDDPEASIELDWFIHSVKTIPASFSGPQESHVRISLSRATLVLTFASGEVDRLPLPRYLGCRLADQYREEAERAIEAAHHCA